MVGLRKNSFKWPGRVVQDPNSVARDFLEFVCFKEDEGL